VDYSKLAVHHPTRTILHIYLTLWRGEVNDIAVRLEHIDLLDLLDRLDVHLLQRGLQLLVVGAAALVDLLDLPSRCALASVDIVLAGVLLDCCRRSNCGQCVRGRV
jgi:hypothetical protein